MDWKETTLFGEVPNSVSGHSFISYKNNGVEKCVLFGGIANDFVRNNSLYEFSLIQNSNSINEQNSTSTTTLSCKFYPPEETSFSSLLSQDSRSSKVKTKLKKEVKLSPAKQPPAVLKIPAPRERHAVSMVSVTHPQTNQTLCFMVLMGGIGNLKTKYNDVWILDLQKMKWRETKCKNNIQPSARYNHQLCTVNDRLLFLFGGYEGDPLNDCWLLLLDLDSLLHHQSSSSSTSQMNTNEEHVVSIEWKEIKIKNASAMPSPRYQHAMVSINSNKFAIVGGTGINRMSLNDVWIFDLETYHFSQVFPNKQKEQESIQEFPMIHAHQCALISNQIVVVGGLVKRFKCCYSRDVYLFDLSTLQWNRVAFPVVEQQNSGSSSSHIFMGRINFGMCLMNGNQLIVFGGIVENVEKGLAYKYNDCLVLDTKIKQSIVNAAPIVSQNEFTTF